MNNLVVLGQPVTVRQHTSNRDLVELTNSQILVSSNARPAYALLKDFLADLLHSELSTIAQSIAADGKVEVLGNLHVDIVDKIDGNKRRIAKLKGNTILVKLTAVSLPPTALHYLVAHELGHTFSKRHSDRFWKMVGLMCPDYEQARHVLTQYEHLLGGDPLDPLFSSRE